MWPALGKGESHETFPSSISVSGSGRCRAPGRIAPCLGANLSNAAGALDRRAPPDGYTLLMIGPPNAVNATLYEKLSFNFIRDITPVATISGVPGIMAVHPSFPAKTIPEFIAYARANPGKVNMASEGIGAGGHVLGELFKMMAGVDLLHVAYRGAAPALTDLMGAQVQVMFATMPASIQYVRAGKLWALAVTTATRSKALPDVPAVGEFVPGYEQARCMASARPKTRPLK
jgi:tripartite-type tricarboxylate transporter receptor subunit TctC